MTGERETGGLSNFDFDHGLLRRGEDARRNFQERIPPKKVTKIFDENFHLWVNIGPGRSRWEGEENHV